jgi:hypothetical protein
MKIALAVTIGPSLEYTELKALCQALRAMPPQELHLDHVPILRRLPPLV